MWILSSLFINIIVSILIIFIGHHIWNFLKEKYSVKKTKDVVGSQIAKYKTILEEIQQNHSVSNSANDIISLTMDNEISANETVDYIDMKNDLEKFIQEI